MLKDVCNSFNENGNAIQIPSLISLYCWQCVEEDLRNIRKFLGDFRAKYGVFKYEFQDLEPHEKKLIQVFCQEINSITTEKFRIISSWFNKPSIASPSANIVLLFNAVVSEVKDTVIGFEPEIKLDLDKSFTISGGLYFGIYDALSVLIHNAARHGKKNGSIEFLIDGNSSDTSIKLSVISEVDDHSTLDIAEKKIVQCLNDDFNNAHVFEGKSGIKKLRQLENDGHVGNISYLFSREEKITASFDFNVSY